MFNEPRRLEPTRLRQLPETLSECSELRRAIQLQILLNEHSIAD